MWCVSMSVDCIGMGMFPLRTGVIPSWCCALICLTFLVHMLGGSCTGGMFHFSCAAYMMYVVTKGGVPIRPFFWPKKLIKKLLIDMV